jgi:hypothetical protein
MHLSPNLEFLHYEPAILTEFFLNHSGLCLTKIKEGKRIKELVI